jgi:uncharacterized protein YbaA (DUF1428 family)
MENKKLLTGLLVIVLATVVVFVFGYLNNNQAGQTVEKNSSIPLESQTKELPKDKPQGVKPPTQPNLTPTEKAAVTTPPGTTSPVVSQQQPSKDQPQGAKPSLQPSLTSDEKAALAASSAGSKLDATQQAALAAKVAKETGSINVTNCQLDPVVLKVKYQTNFTLKNKGTDEAAVVFYVDNVAHSVPGGSETSVKADFGKQGSGLFGYYCRAGSNVFQGLVLMYNL